MSVVAVVLGVVIGIVVALLLLKPFFGTREEFFGCLKFWMTPDIVSMFRGEYLTDWWSETKLGFWIAASALSGIATYIGIMKLFGLSW